MNSKCNTTWSKSNVIQTYDGAKVTVFVRFESESARRRHVRCSCSRSDIALVEIFTGPAPIDWTQEATMVKVRIYFYLRGSFKCMIVILPTFWRSAPALKFSWQLTRNVSLATMLVYSYRRSLDEDGRSLWVGTPRSSFTASSVVNFFSPGAPVTSFLCQPISTAIPVSLASNKTKPTLSTIAVVSKAFKGTARTSLCRIWEHPQRCFPPFGKSRTKHRRTVFSMNKAQESKQRSTNWRRRHLENMQQQRRRWPGFDKCVKTKLRLDVYIRPWPPGWSFLRCIYTSRGSERVNIWCKSNTLSGLIQILPRQCFPWLSCWHWGGFYRVLLKSRSGAWFLVFGQCVHCL